MIYTREQFLEKIGENYVAAVNLVVERNNGYGGADEPYRNFNRSAIMSGVERKRGVLVRLCDKLGRIENLLDNGVVVGNEKLEDTLLDAMNYLNIILTMIQEAEETEKIEQSDTYLRGLQNIASRGEDVPIDAKEPSPNWMKNLLGLK